MSLFGIDRSSKNGRPDYFMLKNGGVHFALVRATNGNSLYGKGNPVDSLLEENIKGLSENHIHIGVYHIFGAQTLSEALDEADFFIETVKNYGKSITLHYICYVPVGKSRISELGQAELLSLCEIFCKAVENYGMPSCLYINVNGDDILPELNYWLKNTEPENGIIGKPNPEGGRLAYHKYCENGMIGGTDGTSGLNFGYGEPSKLILNKICAFDMDLLHRIEETDKGEDTLCKLAAAVIEHKLHPMRDPSYEKTAMLIKVHCGLSEGQLAGLLTLKDSEYILHELYRFMLR